MSKHYSSYTTFTCSLKKVRSTVDGTKMPRGLHASWDSTDRNQATATSRPPPTKTVCSTRSLDSGFPFVIGVDAPGISSSPENTLMLSSFAPAS
jgi:hypothetical protein